MNNTIDDFIDSKESESLRRLNRWMFDRMIKYNIDVDNLHELTVDDITNIIIQSNPINIKYISTIASILKHYAEFNNDNITFENIKLIDRNDVWNSVQKLNKNNKRFISEDEFNDLIFNIEISEPFNSLYYSTLLRCIWYGIYNEDMSVLKNLRASDINIEKCQVVCKPDNEESFLILLPSSLVEDLIELSNTNIWQRKNGKGICNIDVDGLYYDSCFKLESRGDADNYRYSFYYRIRKITNSYLYYIIKPKNLFISGIMSRINRTLKKDGLNLEYAFKEHTRTTYSMLKNELNRSHYTVNSKYFRQLVSGHLKEFED